MSQEPILWYQVDESKVKCLFFRDNACEQEAGEELVMLAVSSR